MTEQSQPSEIGLTEAASRISSLLGGGSPEPGTEKKAAAPAAVINQVNNVAMSA